MYDLAKKARAGMKSKAERLAGEKDRKTDSSDWSPAPELNADVKTGMRPVSRRAYKKGGKVMGMAAPVRADRKPRKANDRVAKNEGGGTSDKKYINIGGKRVEDTPEAKLANLKKTFPNATKVTKKGHPDWEKMGYKAGGKVEQKGEQPLVDRYINRDLKKANEYRDGKKHVGALKHGGRAKKMLGGPLNKLLNNLRAAHPTGSYKGNNTGGFGSTDAENVTLGLKKGGRAARANGGRAHKNEGGGASNPAREALRRAVAKGKPVDWDKIAPAPYALAIRRQDAKEAKEATAQKVKPLKPEDYKSGGRAKKQAGGEMAADQHIREIIKSDAKNAAMDDFVKRKMFENKEGKIPLPPERPKNLNPPPKKVKPDPKGYIQGDVIDTPQWYGQKRKDGGRANHPDVKEDKALIEKMVKPSAMKGDRAKKNVGGPMMMDPRLGIVKNKAMEFGQDVVTPGLKKGGRVAKQIGGALGKALGRGMPNAQQVMQRPGMGGGMNRPVPMGGKRPMMGMEQPMQMGAGFPGGPPIGSNPALGGGRLVPPNQGQVPITTMPTNPIYGGLQSAAPRASLDIAANDQQYLQSLPPEQRANFESLRSQGIYNQIPQQQAPMMQSPMPGQMPTQSDLMASAQQRSAMEAALANMPYDPATARQAIPQGALPRKNGGRVARAYGGEINDKNEGKKSKSGKSSVNIVINTGKSDQQGAAPNMPIGSPPMPMPTMTAPPPPPSPLGGGMPPSPPAMGGMPPMPPDGMMPSDGMMPPMGRKSGGRVTKVAKSYKDMEAGAGSGEGRLQKTDIAKRIPKPAFEKGFNPYEGRGYPNKVLGATGGRTARKEGGKVYRSYKDMDAGAGSGKGRMEKTEIQSRKK